jgi:hypothetical protein
MTQENTRGGVFQPVIAGGRLYPSIGAAAAALGLNRNTIRVRLKSNANGYLYASPGGVPFRAKPSTVNHRGGNPGRPVIVEGTRYPGVRAAAAAIGVSHETVQTRISKGRDGYRYISPRTTLHRGGHPGNPVVVDGVRYPSRRAAAAEIGVTAETIRRRIQNKVAGYQNADQAPPRRRFHAIQAVMQDCGHTSMPT